MFKSKIYQIDFNRWATLLIPTALRNSRFIAWVKVLVSPIVYLHQQFLKKRSEDIYRLTHNSQVRLLRKVLNDAFDPIKRRIVLTDGNRYEQPYIYTEFEKRPQFLGTIFIRDEQVYKPTGVDGLIIVPQEVWDAQKTEINSEIRFFAIEALTDRYRMPGIRYKITL